MARWLQRYEAITWWSGYLTWRLDESDASEGAPDPPDSGADPLDDEDEPEDPATNDVADDESETTTTAIRETSSAYGLITAIPPSVAKTAAHPNLPVSIIEDKYNATGFTDALAEFLSEKRALRPGYTPSNIDSYDVFNTAVLHMKPRPYLNSKKLRFRVRATPPKSNGPRKLPTPAQTDTVLVLTDASAQRRYGGLHGLRVAEVRVLFKVPTYLSTMNEPLVYVQWFRELQPGALDPHSRMFKLERSTRNHLPHAAVVPLSQVIRPCHLVPRYTSGSLPPTWLHGHSMRDAKEFLLNRYIDLAMVEDYATYFLQ